MTPDAAVMRTLQTGWWEDVLLVDVDGAPRVRKRLHRLDAPWAREVFIQEWRYLRGLPASLRPPFVQVLAECDELLANPPPSDRPLWFDMEHLDGFTDVRALLAEGGLDISHGCCTGETICLQELLIAALLDGLYRLPGAPFEADRIIWPVIEQVLALALTDAELGAYARADSLDINGEVHANLRRTVPTARADDRVRAQLESVPSVRLHGDLFYENVLYRADPPAIRLIDPVSVAGVEAGPVVFDRVKFASWLGGELYALRHGAFELSGEPGGTPPRVQYVWDENDPVLSALQEVDLGSGVLAAMDELTGPSDEAQAVLEAYFNLAMVANTPMPQKLLRYARAVERLAAWA